MPRDENKFQIHCRKTTDRHLQTAYLAVEGMHCAGCAVAIHEVLCGLEGVYRVGVAVEEALVAVVFDPVHLQPRQLIEAVTNVGGEAGGRYQARLLAVISDVEIERW